MECNNNQLSTRIEKLRSSLLKKGFKDRSGEWVIKENLPDIGTLHEDRHVIVRKAIAIDAMLESLCNVKLTGNTHCYEIEEGSLLAGIIPMGSNGLGKVFPNYLTEDEIRVGSVTNKSQMAVLGHNTINYENVVNRGLKYVIKTAIEKLVGKTLSANELEKKLELTVEEFKNSHKDKIELIDSKRFYWAVLISCNAVIQHSKRYAKLAREEAFKADSKEREEELHKLADICERVPMEPANNFYEAMQSIWMVHCCLHSTLDYMSLGRLDQVLMPFYKEEDREFNSELIQNFIIKAAGRLNFTTQYLVQQDHMDYNAALGIHPYYLDQRAGLNNFLQNIIIGGKKPSGEDATNECTYLLLEAFRKVNLSTPGLYVRLHDGSPEKLVSAVADSIEETKNLPYILNDEVMIPAMKKALAGKETDAAKLQEYERLANDYCVDGCWELVLNGVSDWTFGMVNGMTMLECTLNRGATLSSAPALLRGQKLSIDTGLIESYEDFKSALKRQIQFFADQSGLATCLYYPTSAFSVPTPLVSGLFDHCLEKGLDKSWGGAEYNIAGTILGGVPDMVNTIAAIKKFVFDEAKYSLEEVLAALRFNFKADESDYSQQKLFDNIRVDFFTNSPKFGNTTDVEDITKLILDSFYDAVLKANKLAHKVFIDSCNDGKIEVQAQRTIAGYYGKSLQSILRDHLGVCSSDDELNFSEEKKICDKFRLIPTAGVGTFEQYNWQGTGVAASASRNAGDPLAPNFSPTSGTWHQSPGVLLESFKNLGLGRFAGVVITDMCLEEGMPIDGLLRNFISNRGGALTITISSPEYQEIYELMKAADQIKDKEVASEKLEKYADIMVRVGGWNAPFITLPLSHMENYLNRKPEPEVIKPV